MIKLAHDLTLDRHECICGEYVEPAWAGQIDGQNLGDAARSWRHDHDAIGQKHGLVDVMGDEQDGAAEVAPDLQQPLLHAEPRLRVESAERFVEQHDLPTGQNGAHHGRTLPHAPRQGVRIMVQEVAQTVTPRQFRGSDAIRFVGASGERGRKRDVAKHGAPGQKQILLQHVADLARAAADVLPIEHDASRAGLQQTRNHVEERALAAAGGAEDADELAGPDLEIDMAQRQQVAEPHRKIVDGKLDPGGPRRS